MQTIPQIIPSNTPTTPPAETGPRELQWSELAQVAGGLPKGGWAAKGPGVAAGGLSSEAPLSQGGWQPD